MKINYSIFFSYSGKRKYQRILQVVEADRELVPNQREDSKRLQKWILMKDIADETA